MTIDENTINHNAVRLISDASKDYIANGVDVDETNKIAVTTIGYVCGICNMANAMKEALKNN